MRAIKCYKRFGARLRSGIAGQRGFTLVEIMVALTLGLVVTIGVIQVFLGTQQSARIQQATSRMQEDGRIAMDLLNHYIRLAGYTTYPWDKGGGFPPSASAPFTQDRQVVTGGDNNVNGSDSIRIRYQGAADGSITTCLGGVVPLNQMADITFSLSNPDVNGVQSLWCTDNTVNPVNPQPQPPQPLVASLQNMQILYGISSCPPGGQGVDPVGRLTGATTYLTATQVTAINQWQCVISVQISLLVQSAENNLASQPQTFTFPITNNQPTTPPPNDRRLRYVIGMTANIRNQSNIPLLSQQ